MAYGGGCFLALSLSACRVTFQVELLLSRPLLASLMGKEKHRRRPSPRRDAARLFLLICAYRITNAWMVRTQFDPDEYWQTLEPSYCLVFSSQDPGQEVDMQRTRGCALTWEWTRRLEERDDGLCRSDAHMERAKCSASKLLQQALHGPVRSYVSLLPTYGYYKACRSLFRWTDVDEAPILGSGEEDSDLFGRLRLLTRLVSGSTKRFIRRNATYIVAKGPVYIHAILVAAPTDLCTYLIADRLSKLRKGATSSRDPIWTTWPFWALVCSLTSWFHGYALIRTYANSFEAVCLSVGVAMLHRELFGVAGGTDGERESARESCNNHQLQAKLAFVLGGLSACVRFTSLAAWIPIGCIVAYRKASSSQQPSFYRSVVGTLFGLCGLYGLMGVVLGCAVDRTFYGFWAVPSLGNFHFNVVLGNGSLYGTHPSLWYLYAGLPAICGVLLPFLLWSAVDATAGQWRPSERDNPLPTLFAIISPYIALHSVSAHKEFRFLLPILPLVCILVGQKVSKIVEGTESSTHAQLRRCKLLFKGLLVSNFPHLIYLSMIHQRGPIALNQFLSARMEENARSYTVHYLMGCHSAPVYSHLHMPNSNVTVRYLDCSPECRSDEEAICESDAFTRGPFGFMLSNYLHSSAEGTCENSDEGETCGETLKIRSPSYIVMMKEQGERIHGALTKQMNMKHVATIPHTIKSISWHGNETSQDSHALFSLINIHFDTIKVYEKEGVKPWKPWYQQ